MSVKLRLESEFKDKGIKKAKSEVAQFASYAGGVFRRLGAAFVGIFAVSKISGFVTSSVRAFMDAERASKRLEQALASNGESIDIYGNRLENVAKALQTIARVDDDAVIDAMALGSRYGIAADNLDEAAAAAVAFSKAYGMPMESAIKGISEAFRGNTALIGRQVLALKGITDANEAFKAIVAMTNRLLREQAGLNGTNAEKLQAISVAYGQLKETFGGFLLQSGGVSMMLDNVLLALEDIQKAGFEKWLKDTLPALDEWVDRLEWAGKAIDGFKPKKKARSWGEWFSSFLPQRDVSVDGTSGANKPMAETKSGRLDAILAERQKAVERMLAGLREFLGAGGLSGTNKPPPGSDIPAAVAQSRSLSIGDLFEIAAGQQGKKDPVVNELEKQTEILEEIRDGGVGGLVED